MKPARLFTQNKQKLYDSIHHQTSSFWQ